MVARAFADRADAGGAIEFEMNDAAFAGRHGTEAEGLAGLADALSGHAGGKFQFLEARVAVAGAIEAHAVVQTGIEAKPAMGDVFEREEEFGVVLEEKVLVGAMECDGDFSFAGRRAGFGGGGYVVFDGEAERRDGEGEKTAQFIGRVLAHDSGRAIVRGGSAFAHSFFFLNLLREGSGCVRLRYHCWAIPTALLVK